MRLGIPIRIIEGMFILIMLSVLGYALVISGDEFVYDLSLVRVMLTAGLSVRAVWLIERRAASARRYIPAACLVAVGLTVIDVLASGIAPAELQVIPEPAQWLTRALYVVVMLGIAVYFLRSAHVREAFVVDLALEDARRSKRLDDDFREKPFTWPWFRNLGIYYCVFSIVGHWAEIAFCWLIVLGVFDGSYDFSHAQLWEQWLYPYPAEGIAVVLIVLLLYPLKEWLLERFDGRVAPALVVSFFANAAVCTLIDFTTGITANANYELWDYRDMPFNFMGQIVLQNSIVYSVAATLVVWLLYPLMANALHKAPKSLVNSMFFGLAGFYLFLTVLYFVHIGPQGLVFG